MTKNPYADLGFPPEIIRFLGKKWVVPIFREIADNNQGRFGELKEKFGITSKVLSEVLGEMKELGFIKKQTAKSFPPKAIYLISNRGMSLLQTLDMLEEFSKKSEDDHILKSNSLKSIKKFIILLTIEKSILNMGRPELKKVEDKLLSDFNCTLEDCVSNPLPLKKVLCELFGNCYADIYDIMHNSLSADDGDEQAKQFLEIMRK